MSIVDLIPSERGQLSFLHQTQLPHCRPFRSEWTWTRRSGEPMRVEVSSKILPDGRWQAFVRDITERKRAEHERESALKWLWTVVEQCPVGITLVMDRTGNKTMTNVRGQRLAIASGPGPFRAERPAVGELRLAEKRELPAFARDEIDDGHAEQLLSGVARHRRRRGVHPGIATLQVGDEDAVGGQLDEVTEASLGGA